MVSVESTEGLERRMKVEVPAERVESEIDKRLKDMGRRAKIKGFRPGKAPLKVVRQQYGAQVREDVVSEFVRSSWARRSASRSCGRSAIRASRSTASRRTRASASRPCSRCFPTSS
jgi:FKBP-type peptidyl-prolyl cis-trans isomerase (trigger factor)